MNLAALLYGFSIMLYAIIADIHSNLEAFQSVLDSLKKERIDRIVIVGDIVGYGADPKECIRLVKSLDSALLSGNHEWAVLGLLDTKWFNEYARAAVMWTADMLNEDEKEFLRKIELTFEDENIIAAHGSLNDPHSFNYIFSADDASKSFIKMDGKRPCFVGHSHQPVTFIRNKDKLIDFSLEKEFSLDPDNQYIINVGSVGQPRDGDNRAAYVIYDIQERRISVKRIEYDIEKAKKKILMEGLPKILADRLSEGR